MATVLFLLCLCQKLFKDLREPRVNFSLCCCITWCLHCSQQSRSRGFSSLTSSVRTSFIDGGRKKTLQHKDFLKNGRFSQLLPKYNQHFIIVQPLLLRLRLPILFQIPVWSCEQVQGLLIDSPHKLSNLITQKMSAKLLYRVPCEEEIISSVI